MSEEELLLEWKEAYGYVYYTEINEVEIVYRNIGMSEYLEIEDNSEDGFARDEAICALCVLQPKGIDWDLMDAGFPRAIASSILSSSGLSDTDGKPDLLTIIENKKEEVYNKFIFQIPLVVKRCFPEYRLDEIKAMPLAEQAELYAQAIWMLETFDNIVLEQKEK